MRKAMGIRIACGVISGLVAGGSAYGGAHTWRVNEAFSNADGTIQFVELKESFGGPGEIFLQGLKVTSDATGSQFTFPGNLAGNTANRHILLATAGFAALPGAPTPDHIIPSNFIGLNGDTLRYHVYDAWAIPSLPTDCVNSFHKDIGVASNTPTNYANQAGHVKCGPPPACNGDATGDQNVNVNDLLSIINQWGACPPPPTTCSADVAPPGGDAVVNVNDLLMVINNWGPCS